MKNKNITKQEILKIIQERKVNEVGASKKVKENLRYYNLALEELYQEILDDE